MKHVGNAYGQVTSLLAIILGRWACSVKWVPCGSCVS